MMNNADMRGIFSALLVSYNEDGSINEKGLREKYIVMVGGAPVNDTFAQQIGADYYTADAPSAAEIAKEAVLKRKSA